MKVIDWQFDLPLRTEAELRMFVRKAFGVTIPDERVCENHTTPWRAFADAYFARSSVSVWKASRGFGGKSHLLALLGLTEAVTLKADVNILGGSGEQSGRVLEYVGDFWQYDSAPRALLSGDVKRETRLAWGNRIQALMASQASVRGPHPQRLRLDEIDEMRLDILDAAMGQTMAAGEIAAQTVMSSTHQYADGTMTEILKRAASKGWPVYEWCWRETVEPHGWLPESEIERKRGEVTESMWHTEYDLQEPSPESRAINAEAVKRMFRRELGVFEGAPNEYIEIEAPMIVCDFCQRDIPALGGNLPIQKCPHCGRDDFSAAQYTTGADWARKKDWTVIMTFRHDCNPAKLVAFERTGRMPWPLMIEKFERQLRCYNARGYHDGTGLGDVVDGHLTVSAEPVIMVGRKRSDLLSNYISAIERNEIVAPHIKFAETSHRLASVDDVYGSGHLPDDIAAGALAYMGVHHGGIMVDVI